MLVAVILYNYLLGFKLLCKLIGTKKKTQFMDDIAYQQELAMQEAKKLEQGNENKV